MLSFISYDIEHLELHSTAECDICRLHRLHSEQSRRAKSLEQVRNSNQVMFINTNEQECLIPLFSNDLRQIHAANHTHQVNKCVFFQQDSRFLRFL